MHEGPHGFGISVPLKAGNVITNEPGYYQEGQFGIRIESALFVKEVNFGDPDDSVYGCGGPRAKWFAFERFTQASGIHDQGKAIKLISSSGPHPVFAFHQLCALIERGAALAPCK